MKGRVVEIPEGVDWPCIHCGKLLRPVVDDRCYHCGQPHASDQETYDYLVRDRPAALVRMYRADRHDHAVAALQTESQFLAARGYLPVGQSWAAGSVSSERAVAALMGWVVVAAIGYLMLRSAIEADFALALVAIVGGIIFGIVLLANASEGSLAVTYVARDLQTSSPS